MSSGNPRASRSPRKTFRLFIALMALLPSCYAAAQDAGPALHWELVNPFRFISDRDSTDELRRVYDGLGQKTAYNLERELQRLSDDEVDKRRGEARKRFDCEKTESDEEKRQCFEPHLGWFARLAENDHAKTCWDSKNQRFRNTDECKGYVHPESHKVRVWVSNSELLGVPQWVVDNKPLTEFNDCTAKYRKGVCAEFDVKYDGRERIVSANFSGGSVALEPLHLRVLDKLVVGLGDSYAAGEGNPDIPARFTQGKKERDFLPKALSGHILSAIFKGTRAPQKDDDKKAGVGWLDERCHRSMYSYQFKTALMLALAAPKDEVIKEAVTYVSYSCSGATTDHIIDKEKKAIEGSPPVVPQLETLRGVLRDRKNGTREIDYLLLSTGGNDIHFSDLVAYVVLPKSLLGALEHLRKVSEETMRSNSESGSFARVLLGGDGSAGKYRRLHTELLKVPAAAQGGAPARIRIKGCEPDKPCPRILLTPYPNIFNDGTNELCKAVRHEFDYPFGPDDSREARIKTVYRYVYEQIRGVQLSDVIPEKLGWTVVRSNTDRYLGHGFCAQNLQSASETGEKFVMPTWKNGRWQSFDPRKYKSYEARQRWVRLPVDSKLTTDQMHKILKLNLDLFLEDDRSNIMHPTAEGLAETADANLEVIRRMEAPN